MEKQAKQCAHMETRQRKGERALHFEHIQFKDTHENDAVQCLLLLAHKTPDNRMHELQAHRLHETDQDIRLHHSMQLK